MSESPETAQEAEANVSAANDENYAAWEEAGDATAETESEGAPASESAPAQETESQAEAAEGEGQQEEQAPGPYDQAPEYWSAERKALWEKITDPEARQAIHETERERSTAVTKKFEEAAEQRKAYEQATRDRDDLARWWESTGPRLVAAFQNKWESVDWNKLAAEDPNRWAQLKQAQENDARLIQEANGRHQAEIRARDERAQASFSEAKRAEHQKLAQKLPTEFGEGKAQASYDRLGKYLTERGIPAERVTAIYEAPVIEIAWKAMLYDEAQAALKAKPTGQPTTATQTPRRVVPGARPGQPTKSDAMRQAEKRLNSGHTLSDDDVEALFG